MSDYVNVKETREGKALSALTDALNSFSWKPEVFAKAATMEHRTLQQSLVRTLVCVIKEMAKSESYDGRNEASVMLCKKIVESGVLDETYLPFV